MGALGYAAEHGGRGYRRGVRTQELELEPPCPFRRFNSALSSSTFPRSHWLASMPCVLRRDLPCDFIYSPCLCSCCHVKVGVRIKLVLLTALNRSEPLLYSLLCRHRSPEQRPYTAPDMDEMEKCTFVERFYRAY